MPRQARWVDREALDRILDEQSGVISRPQLLKIGARSHDIARLIRRRDLTLIHKGIYVNHTGPLLWVQRAWAAVLFCWPAALSHESALRAAEGPGRRDSPGGGEVVLHVAVDRDRHISGPTGVSVHRLARLDSRVHWRSAPPRVRYEEAILDVAVGATTDGAAIALLAEACQSRRTTAQRLLDRVESRTNIVRRRWLLDVLRDVAEGSCSVLELGFLHRVVKPHGLPTPDRQVRANTSGRVTYRDAQLGDSLIVELDGRLFHDNARPREFDFERDLDAAVTGACTVRLTYGQVFDRTCRTALRLARLAAERGWGGQGHPCGPACAFGS